MDEILGGYWQILDRSGKKIILLSPMDKLQTFFKRVVGHVNQLVKN